MDNFTLDRYRPIIPEWDAFREALRRPLPNVIRTNTLRIDPSSLHGRLLRQRITVSRLFWDETLLEIDRSPGGLIEHWLGLFYVQEAAQVLPVLALAPQPGETILDLCAAPGGKCTHIAARMQNRGTLVANEPNGRRQQALLANINRLGILNVLVTAYRGENFPQRARFDRVLVDAPCSGEGSTRKDPTLQQGIPPRTIHRLAEFQKRLIVHAFDLLRPGGTLVYSTCTFAPEENESVVFHLLGERDAHLTALTSPFVAATGLGEWNGRIYPPEMAGCVRVYPHHLDSGGGFVARIERP